MRVTRTRWLAVSPPLPVDDIESPPRERERPTLPPPDLVPEETPEQGSQD